VSSSSFHQDTDIFGEEEDKEEDDAFNHSEDEVQVEYDIQEHDEIWDQDHVAMDDQVGLGTNMGVVLDVPKDPEIIPPNLGYDEIGIITDAMLDKVIPHSTSVWSYAPVMY
jgi:hypothetical protein